MNRDSISPSPIVCCPSLTLSILRCFFALSTPFNSLGYSSSLLSLNCMCITSLLSSSGYVLWLYNTRMTKARQVKRCLASDSQREPFKSSSSEREMPVLICWKRKTRSLSSNTSAVSSCAAVLSLRCLS